MMETLCGWTNETWGKALIAGTLIVVGGSHFGYFSTIPSMSLPLVGNVGNLMGIAALVGGVCMLTACCLPMSASVSVGESSE